MKMHICTTSRAARAAASVTAVNMGGYVYCHLAGFRHAGKLLPAFVVKDADSSDIAFFCILQALTPVLTAFAPVGYTFRAQKCPKCRQKCQIGHNGKTKQ